MIEGDLIDDPYTQLKVLTHEGRRDFTGICIPAGHDPSAGTAALSNALTGLPLSSPGPFSQIEATLAIWGRGAVPCPINTRWPKPKQEEVARHLAKVQQKRSEEANASDDRTGGFDPWGALIHTSGSAGIPKPAVLSWTNLLRSATTANAHLDLCTDDRWLLSLPLHHVGGLSIVLRCLVAGAVVAVPEEDDTLESSLERFAPTHLSLVATQLYRLLRDELAVEALARCKVVLMGGGPVSEGLVRDAAARGIPIFASYGMTETASMIACTQPGDSIGHLLTSGKPLVEGTVSISDDGEILVRGDTLFQGYLRPDGSIDRPLTPGGWFATGDLGFLDHDGYLRVTGRRDNMFISGGENIQPEEIEQCLCEVEGVEEAVVVPADDPEWGQRAVAFVRYAEGGRDEAALRGELCNRLPSYKIPKAFLPWPEDLDETGLKISRADLQRRARELESS